MATTRDGGLLTTRAIMQAPLLVEPVGIVDCAFPRHKPKAKALAIQFIAVLIPRPPKPRINRFASTDRRALSLRETEHLNPHHHVHVDQLLNGDVLDLVERLLDQVIVA